MPVLIFSKQPDEYISVFSLRNWAKMRGDVLTTEQVVLHTSSETAVLIDLHRYTSMVKYVSWMTAWRSLEAPTSTNVPSEGIAIQNWQL